MFHSARLKLTLGYTLAIAFVMAAFSVALYLALRGTMAGNLEVGGSGGAQVDQLILAAELSRARLVLLAVNVAGWVLAAAISYVIAGLTLRPIEASLSRQRQFTAHASHELRTPLTVMKGEVDLALARERTALQYRQTLSRVDEEVSHLETLVRDLLTLARSETARGGTKRERCEVGPLVRQIVEPWFAPLAERAVDLNVSVSPGLVGRLDWTRVRHLLSNLIENAARHTPPRGRIEVTASQRGGDLEVAVFNSGSRIAEDDLPHLFLPFYRGKGSNCEAGTGLGLALCEWIARAHGGSIRVQNERNGVTFLVRLPRG